MMRSTNFLRWVNGKSQKSVQVSQNGTAPWIHPPGEVPLQQDQIRFAMNFSPGALQGAHVVYLVKFLGCTEVDRAKGMEVVKAGIQKMKFNSNLKRSEGAKISKVELTISIDGVAIQDPKTKRILYQYPLYHISYCCDDKAEKRFFCFIAKEENSTDHRCFVFVSDRLAENITLTIGQAFDLAYRRFLETSGRELEMRKQILILQKRAKALESENMELRKRLGLYENVPNPVEYDSSDHSETNGFSDRRAFKENGVADPFLSFRDLRQQTIVPDTQAAFSNDLLQKLDPPPLPPRPGNPRSPPPSDSPSDLITLDPFAVKISAEEDPFGDFQKLFANGNGHLSNRQFDEAIDRVDKRISDMKEGFGRGLSIEDGDFNLASFDPLTNASRSS